MANTVTDRPHPLLDPGSLYRLGSELSIWSDDGVGSVRRYFEALRLEVLDEKWLMADAKTLANPDLWDWGYDDETNRRIHAARLRAREAANVAGKAAEKAARERMKWARARGGALAALADPFELPAVIEIDLLEPDLGDPAGVVRASDPMFPGLKEEERKNEAGIHEFWLDIPVGPGQDGRSGLVLLLTRGLVEQLNGVLEWRAPEPPGPRDPLPRKEVNSQDAALEVIKSALAPENLEPADDASPMDLWRASRLSLIWSCAPGLKGRVVGGKFVHPPFPLSDNPKRVFPHVPGDVWLVRCLGGRDA